MKNIWEFYENLDEIVYVSDMDTYEMVYLNRWGRKQLGVPSMEAIAGKPCYEVLQNCSEPCSMCTNCLLKPGSFHEWKYYNPLLRKTFSLKDTMLKQDGRRYRMELSIDINVQEQQQRTIKDFTTYEALLNEGLRLALSAATPNKSMEILLQYIGESLNSDRIYIFEETHDKVFRNTYEWCADGVSPQKHNLQNIPYEAVALWYRSFEKNQNVLIKELEHTKESDPLAYQYLSPQNIHSLVVSPLISNDKIIGFYGVDNPPQEFLDHISIMFEVLGHFIVSIMRRRDLVKRLEALSYYDQLTGAKNRHGMNDFISSVDHQASIGILYCDVMGLKKVNDTKGHLEGDALLIRAYECLKSQFPEETIFRIGGDEFLVLSSGITEEELEQQTEALRRVMPDYNLLMALGPVWRPQCAGQILTLMKEADQRMYADKRKYYELFPQNRRSTDRKS